MSKISISKKTAWSLILKINNIDLPRKDIVNINENIYRKNIHLVYDRKSKTILESNIIFNSEIANLFDIFLPVVFSSKKVQFIGHIAQSLDGYIATISGESKYISSKDNLEHIHRLRAIADIIIVGANTYTEDQPQLTTRLVEGNDPDVYIFDPKKKIKHDQTAKNINIIHDIDLFKKNLDSKTRKIIYIEGGGRTISHFMTKNIFDRLHVCLCPIILGGGRPSFIGNKYIKINKLKSYETRHFMMGRDILFDINL